MAVTSTFDPALGELTTEGDALDNAITTSRNAAGNILVNGGAVPITGGTPTVANTNLIRVRGQGGNDTITLDQANGALPRAELLGEAGNDTITGGASNDLLFGGDDNDTLLGVGGIDFLFGGAGNDTLTGGDADDQVFGDAGNDRMIWNPGDDTDLFEGGADSDTAEVNGGGGAEVFTATANGTRVRFDRLDPAPFFLDIGTTERLVVNMNGGNDSFSATGNLAALIGVTVDGGTGNDTILGTNGIDILLGGEGNDFIDGQQGNDVAFLGAGNDTFQWDPGDGSDTVEGQDGVDALLFNGSAGAEIFEASANGGRVLFTRNLGNIVMDLDDVEVIRIQALGNADNIVINDLSGTDLAVAGLHVNLEGAIGSGTGDGAVDTVTVNGAAGDEVISVFPNGTVIGVIGVPAAVTIFNGESTDRLVVNGNAGNDTINAPAMAAGAIALTLDGGIGNDTITGGSAADQLLGQAGDDTLIGAQGNDIMIGGTGNDAYFVDNIGDQTIENPGEGNDTAFSTGHFRLSVNLDNLVLQGSADLQAFGNSAVNGIFGNSGSNILDGDAGADVMMGGAGNDAYFVDDAGDQTIENPGEGNDTVFSTAHFRLSANLDNLVLQGSADLQAFGNGAVNGIFGNSGSNILDGAAGADVMIGGAGNDAYFVDNSLDQAIENPGEGNDTVFTTIDLRLSANLDNLVLQGSSDLQGYGNSAANVIAGNSGSNILNGEAGVDGMFGGAGNDTYFVDNAGDVVVENAAEGNDTVFASVNYALAANVDNLVLQGGADLQGRGNSAVNAIFGNDGNNLLDGEGSADVLTGNSGNDTFIFSVGQGNGDTVVDFAGNGAGAGDSLLFVGYGPGATFTNIDATHWQVNFNGGASHDVITFSNGAAINASDFLFI